MSIGLPPQSSDPKIVATTRAFVVYDRATGEVLGRHHSVEFQNGAPAREDPAARALRLARVMPGVDAGVLEVDGKDVNHPKPIRVDTARRVVVVEDRAARRRG